MDNKFKKSKYAAIILASTMALSTVASVTPQAFGETPITAHATASTGAEVKDLIVALDATNLIANASGTDYITAVSNAASAYESLDDAQKKKVSNAKLLKAHQALVDNTELVAAIRALTKAETITDDTVGTYNKVTTTGDAIKIPDTKELTDKKGKKTVVGKNTTLEGVFEKLADFKKVYDAAVLTNKDIKTPLSKVYKAYTATKKAADKADKEVNASYAAKSFIDLYTALKAGGKYATSTETVKLAKDGSFKVGSDKYIIKKSTTDANKGKLVVLDPLDIEVVLQDTAENQLYSVIEKDTDTDTDEKATLINHYYISTANGSVKKVEKTIEKAIETSGEAADNVVKTISIVPLLSLNSKMETAEYKKLVAGTSKYSDAQLDVINAASKAYKKLSAAAKKLVTSEQLATLKEYEAGAKAQEALEKKLVSEDSKGVTKKIGALKFKNNDVAKYKADIQEAREAYRSLSTKYKKKIKAATLKSLENHEAAVEIMEDIAEIDTQATALLTATNEAGLTNLENAIKAINSKTTGSYYKKGSGENVKDVDKKVQTLVKNFKNLATYEKLINAQKEYFKNSSALTGADGFETKLTALTGTKSLRVVNNMVLLGENASDVYKITVDKTTKEVTLTQVAPVANTTAKEYKIASSTEPDTTTVSGFALTNNKGKFSARTTIAEASIPVKLLDLKGKTLDEFKALTEGNFYAKAKIDKINDAVEAYTKANGNKAAKAYINKEDANKVKEYQTSLKQQDALVKKVADEFNAAVKALKYSTETVAADDETISKYENDYNAAAEKYTDFTTKYPYYIEDDKTNPVKASKTALDNHQKAAKVASLILVIPAIAEITVGDEGKNTAVTSARTEFDKLTIEQKKLITAGETTLKAAENRVTTINAIAGAITLLSGNGIKVTISSEDVSDTSKLLPLIKALDTATPKNTAIEKLAASALTVANDKSKVTVTFEKGATTAADKKVDVAIEQDYAKKLESTLKDKTFEFETAADTATDAELATAVKADTLATALATGAQTQLAAATFKVITATTGKITVSNPVAGANATIEIPVKLKTTKAVASGE